MGIPHTCACMHACSAHPPDWGQEVSRAHLLVMLHLPFVSLSIRSFNQRFEEHQYVISYPPQPQNCFHENTPVRPRGETLLAAVQERT